MVEVLALRDGLMLGKAEGVWNLEIETLLQDNQIANHPLGNILLDCRSLMEELEAVSIKHIYREANHCADALASDAPISVGDFYVYPCILICIVNILYADLIGVVYPRIVNAI